MTTQRSEKAHFPFEAKDPTWAARCLAVSCDDIVRVVRREPLPAQWCVAQDADGQVGLLPTVILKKTEQRGGDLSINSSHTAGRTPIRRHFDPLAAVPIQTEEECLVLESDGHVSHLAEANNEPEVPQRGHHNGADVDMISVSSSNPSSADTTPQKLTPQHQNSAASEIDEDGCGLADELANRSRATRERSAKKTQKGLPSPNPRTGGGASAHHYPAFCKEDPAAQELFDELLLICAETERLGQVKRQVERELSSAKKRTLGEEARRLQQRKKADKELMLAKERLGKLGKARETLQQLAVELEQGFSAVLSPSCTPSASPQPHAQPVMLGKRDPNEIPNGSKAANAADGSAGDFMSDLLLCERETLVSYICQAEKLQKRQEKVDSLATALAQESETLAKSEKALATVEAIACADEDDARPEGIKEWPRTLEGLTEEEDSALANYVRLYDKYEAKRQAVLAENPEDLAAAQKAKVEARIAKGDAEVEKMTRELEELRRFVQKYQSKADKMEEQIAIGRDVLEKKTAYFASLTGSTSET